MLSKFNLDIEPEVFDDIQQAVDYYNLIKPETGKRFFNTVDEHFAFLKQAYLSFAIRYDDIRCMPVDKFPYMIHYRVLKHQKTVSVKAVFCTYDNPVKWTDRIE